MGWHTTLQMSIRFWPDAPPTEAFKYRLKSKPKLICCDRKFSKKCLGLYHYWRWPARRINIWVTITVICWQHMALWRWGTRLRRFQVTCLRWYNTFIITQTWLPISHTTQKKKTIWTHTKPLRSKSATYQKSTKDHTAYTWQHTWCSPPG